MTDTVKVGLKINLKNYESLDLVIEREMPSGVDQAQSDILVRDLDTLAASFAKGDPATREAIDAYRKRVLTVPAQVPLSPALLATPAPAPFQPPPDAKGPVEVPLKIYEKEPARPKAMPPVKPPAREEKKAPEQPAKKLILEEPADPTKTCEFPGCGKPCQPTIWRISHTIFGKGYCKGHYESEFKREAEARKK